MQRPSSSRFLTTAVTLLVSLAISFGSAFAADSPDIDATLDSVRQQFEAVRHNLKDDTPDAELLRLREQVVAAQAQAADTATALAPQLAGVQARLTELGAAAPGAKEDADLAAQRAQLGKAAAGLDAQIKLARLLSVEGDQLADQLWSQRRSRFQERLGERTSSVLGRAFRSELTTDLPRDGQRLAALGRDLASAAKTTPVWAWAGLLVIAIGVWPLRAALERIGQRLITARVAAGRLRRSLFALMVLLLWMAAAGTAAQALQGAFDWSDTLPTPTASLFNRFITMLWFGGYIGGLTTALVCARQPPWRMLPLPDPVATRLRRLPLSLALVSVASWLAERLASLINVSLAMTVAINCLVAIALGLTLGVPLLRAARVWRQTSALEGHAQRWPIWLTVVSIVGWVVLIGGLVSLLTGFVAFGSFAFKQLVWIAIVLGSGTLLAMLTDDAIKAWLAPRLNGSSGGIGGAESVAAAALASGPALPRPREHAAVLLSALLRLALLMLAMMLLLAPFGEGPADLLRRSGQWPQALTIGEVQLRPTALLQAMLALVGCVLVVRLIRRWLTQTYLPTTTLDPGMRDSLTTLFGYLGGVIAISLALSALGIGLERIAWVASALSVGIGFGLQAVVQNFVSGLILLAERPVKVGDWVSLGGVEGDIRRINVRATEIQMGDRSTVIVPNSEFITKVVRNVTLANPIGLVQVKLPIPLGNDPEKVRALMLAAFEAADGVLEEPAPSVMLDGIDAGNLLFNATGFGASPRVVGNLRSELLFDILARLQAVGIFTAPAPVPAATATPAV